MKNIDSNLATGTRTLIILVIVWGIVFFNNSLTGVKELTRTNWIFLILSGAATGLSWLFYFKALQLGNALKVAPLDKLSVALTILLSFVILRESISLKVMLGGVLIVIGSIVILMDQ